MLVSKNIDLHLLKPMYSQCLLRSLLEIQLGLSAVTLKNTESLRNVLMYVIHNACYLYCCLASTRICKIMQVA